MKTYLIVTVDEFELPCVVCDNLSEVASFLGVSCEYARQAVFHGYVVDKSYRVIRVDID